MSVTRFDRELIQGFVRASDSFLSDSLELLTQSGSVLKLPYAEVKVVCFVRDFENADAWRGPRGFASRPKTAGLWLRLTFRDGDTTEAILANNLLQIEEKGFHLIPPDPNFQNQRIFVPRMAVKDAQVLGVIGAKLRKPAARKPTQEQQEEQLEMFPGEPGG